MAHAAIAAYGSSSADLVYGVAPNGKMRHISEVKSGAACGCVCPACGDALVAKKGPENEHHFAHPAGSSCRNAAETALHRLAKEIVEEARKLWLPAVTASYGRLSRVLHRAREISFTRTVSESRHLQSVVPDLFAELDGHLLLVEIYVTHQCDAMKLAELRAKGIATLEIDLSTMARTASREEVRQAVLLGASRHWVYHPKIDAEVAAMRDAAEKQKQAAQRKLDAELDAALADYHRGLEALKGQDGPDIDEGDEVRRAGMAGHLGIAVGGAGCFTVGLREWQYWILSEFLPDCDNAVPSYWVKELHASFKQRNWIRAHFRFVRPELEKALTAKGVDWLSPYRAIEAYLDELVVRNVLSRHHGYRLHYRLESKIVAHRAADERRRQMREDVLRRIDKILDIVPAAERGDLTAWEWMDFRQGDGISFTAAINDEDVRLQRMLSDLGAIEGMIFRKGAITETTLLLPIEGERKRQRTARDKEAADREEKRRAADEAAREDRIRRLRSEAEALAGDAAAWVDAPHPRLGGRRPLQMAEASESDLASALTELRAELRRRHTEREQRAAIEELREELQAEVSKILGDAAKPFLGSPYRDELGGQKPLDYCVSRKTLEECIELARNVKKMRGARR